MPSAVEQSLTAAAVRAMLALPPAVQARIAGPVPLTADGLHPEAWFLARISGLVRDEPVDAVTAREEFPGSVRAVGGRADVPMSTRAVTIPADGDQPALRARLYVPMQCPPPGPLLVFLHGGGWVVGDLDTHDVSCRRLAHQSGVRVLAVDYRLAPEHPFPAAADDAVRAFRWAAANAAQLGADPARIAVGGDSAGGNLAAVVALETARDPVSPAFQLLIYPVTDMTHGPARYPSYERFAEGYVLTREWMDWYDEQYTPDPAMRSDPRASPLLADPKRRKGLAPAHVAVAVSDPLRDEGVAYADALQAAGVAVELRRVPHLHGFFNMGALRTGRAHQAELAGVLRRALVP